MSVRWEEFLATVDQSCLLDCCGGRYVQTSQVSAHCDDGEHLRVSDLESNKPRSDF